VFVGHAGESMLRAVRLIATAVVALAATAAPAHAGGSACGVATARAAIASTQLQMKLFGADSSRVDPKSADQVICFDFTRDGRLDVAVTIASGGTAGDIGFVVFRASPAGWRVALARGGYKVGLSRAGGDLVASQPVYRKKDPNCCPTGGFDHVRYHWNSVRFVVVRSWRTKFYRP
jgi:hypothetical protein